MQVPSQPATKDQASGAPIPMMTASQFDHHCRLALSSVHRMYRELEETIGEMFGMLK